MNWAKAYWILLLLFSVVLTGLIIAELSTMSGSDTPLNIATAYSSYHDWFIRIFWTGVIILLIIANIRFLSSGKSLFLWLTWCWFALFMTWQAWFIGEMFFRFRKSHNLWEGETSMGGIFGIFITAVGLALVILNYWLGRKKDETTAT